MKLKIVTKIVTRVPNVAIAATSQPSAHFPPLLLVAPSSAVPALPLVESLPTSTVAGSLFPRAHAGASPRARRRSGAGQRALLQEGMEIGDHQTRDVGCLVSMLMPRSSDRTYVCRSRCVV